MQSAVHGGLPGWQAASETEFFACLPPGAPASNCVFACLPSVVEIISEI